MIHEPSRVAKRGKSGSHQYNIEVMEISVVTFGIQHRAIIAGRQVVEKAMPETPALHTRKRLVC